MSISWKGAHRFNSQLSQKQNTVVLNHYNFQRVFCYLETCFGSPLQNARQNICTVKRMFGLFYFRRKEKYSPGDAMQKGIMGINFLQESVLCYRILSRVLEVVIDLIQILSKSEGSFISVFEISQVMNNLFYNQYTSSQIS